MKTVMRVSKQAQWLAGIVATIATLMVVAGPLTLAEHYALAGANVTATDGSLARHAVAGVSENS